MRRPNWADLGAGLGVGGFSGLLGVGGGILLVPYLTAIRRMPQKPAQATSLVLVSMGAASGMATYALNARVAWIPALIVLTGGLVGAWIGAHAMQRVHDRRLRIGFGFILLATAVRMALPTPTPDASAHDLPTLTVQVVLLYVLGGLAMGLLSALFGIGGGIVLVPILVTVLGYEQQLANGTSLAVMMAIALFGAIRLTGSGLTNWHLGLTLGSTAVVGAIAGAAVALLLPSGVLQLVFAVVLTVMGIQMIRSGIRLGRGHVEVPPSLGP